MTFFASPIGRWCVIVAIIIAVGGAGEIHGRIAQSERDLAIEMKHEEAVRNAAIAEATKVQKGLMDAQAQFAARAQQTESNLKAQLARANAKIKTLNEEAAQYVSDANSSVCPSVTVGYLVFRARVSDLIANGHDTSAAVPTPDAAKAAAGVSLRDVATTIDAPQAAAYAACRARDEAWAKHVDDLEAWAAAIRQKLQGDKAP